MTLDNGNYGIVLVVLWVMQDLYHQPSTLNPIDPLKELLKGTLIDPFKGTPGFISSAVRLPVMLLGFPIVCYLGWAFQ